MCLFRRKTHKPIEPPPSLDLAFDWVKNVLNSQCEASDILESKATTLFSMSTAVLGIGVSAGILAFEDVGFVTYFFGALALASYGWVFGYSISAIQPRKFEKLDNPITIRERYWDMTPSQFKVELLSHIEDSYLKNDLNLRKKANAIRWLVVATAAEVFFLVLSLAFSL